MKKKWNILLYALAVVLIVGGLLALWLPNRNTEDTEPDETVVNRPDTDPNATFQDLPDWEKERVLTAVADYWAWLYGLDYDPIVWWYGEKRPNQDYPLYDANYIYGVQYYGTFGGYYIILTPLNSALGVPMVREIGEYRFKYGTLAELLAYKEGMAVPLKEIYEKGKLTDEQIGLIYQCYERYRQEIYTRKAWEENGKN